MNNDELSLIDSILSFIGFITFVLINAYYIGLLNYSRKKVLLETQIKIKNDVYDISYSKRFTLHPFKKRRNINTIMISGSKTFPHIFLDSHYKEKFLYAIDKRTFYQSQRVSLEGDFNNYFQLYAPEGIHIDALTILSPDTMKILRDNLHEFDVEIINRNVIIRTTQEFNNDDLLNFIKPLLVKLSRFSRSISVDDQIRYTSNGLRFNNTDEAVKIGTRLVSTRFILTILIFLFPLVALFPILAYVEMSLLDKLMLFMSFLAIGGIGNLVVEYFYRKNK